MPEPSTDTPALPREEGAPPPDILIELRDVSKSFGDNHVLRGISMAVQEGSLVVVMGGSGSGKSVLIKHVVQLLRPDRGEVWVLGRRVDTMDGDALDQLRLSIGYLFQGGALFDSMSVFENMNFILDRHTSLSRVERRERIREALAWVNLSQVENQYPAELSGGQKKRVALARSIILEPRIMLYDEPSTGLDPVSVRMVAELIVRLRDERGITGVAITHDLLLAEIITDKAYFLDEGVFAAEGSLEDLRTSNHPALRNFFGQ